MSSSQLLQTLPFVAGGAIAQHRLVEISAANTVTQCNGATDLAIGVAQLATTAAGASVAIAVSGVAKIEAGAAIVAGTRVGTNASGQAVTKTTDADLCVGVAIEAAGAAGDIISVLLTPGSQRAA